MLLWTLLVSDVSDSTGLSSLKLGIADTVSADFILSPRIVMQ